ncbi:cytochrome P450 [Nocardia brasiliensis]|uniref:cytochrome P450 n=1 Tax=Nocardia brasiliensis TaxID=37326 RepID=UPI003D93786C
MALPLYSPSFAADPRSAYRDMRDRHGTLIPVEIAPGVPATLVTSYHAALQVFGDPVHFPADPRSWQARVAADCPALPLLEWRPDALRATGEEHVRYRQATIAGLDRIDPYTLRGTVERIAVSLINGFCESGSVDLLSHYAIPLTVEVFDGLFGFSPDIGKQAQTALSVLCNADEATAIERGNRMLVATMHEAVEAKRLIPAADLTSWLLEGPAALDETELVQQLAMLYATGTEPTWNLIANTLLLMLTDDRFGGELRGGVLSIRDAIDDVLFTDPPIANWCVSFPRQPQIIEDVLLPEHQPVLISLAACNNDPAVRGDRTGNRSHLAWGAGAHQCPARSVATAIVQEALDQLLDALPDLELAVPVTELRWRPSPFHRGPVAVPTVFPPSQRLPFI